MKILVVSSHRVSGMIGGVSRYLRNFLEIGNSQNHDITIIERGAFIPVITRSIRDVIKMSNQKARFWYNLPEFVDKIYQIYTFMILFLFAYIISIREKYEIILTDDVSVSGLAGFFLHKLKGMNYMIQLHGWPEACKNKSKGRNVTFQMQRKILKSSERIIFAFPDVKGCLMKLKINDSKYRELPLGVDLEKFSPSSEQKDLLREKLKIPSDNFVIGFVGRLSPEKGLFSAVNIISSMQQKIDQKITLVIIGTGEIEKDLRDTAKNMNVDCRFLGHQSCTAKWYNIMDLYLALSSRETFGLSVLEAMATGIPVVASNIDSFRRLFSGNESPGYLVNRNNIDEVINYIKKLIQNPQLRAGMGRIAQLNANQFSIKSSILKLLGIINNQ